MSLRRPEVNGGMGTYFLTVCADFFVFSSFTFFSVFTFFSAFTFFSVFTFSAFTDALVDCSAETR